MSCSCIPHHYFRPYLFGEHITVCKGHSALRWLMNISDPSERLMRRRLRLADYPSDERYKQEKLNCQADALSRIPSSWHSRVHEDPVHPVVAVKTLSIRSSQSPGKRLLMTANQAAIKRTLTRTSNPKSRRISRRPGWPTVRFFLCRWSLSFSASC